jgi:hypothetical protein
MLKIIRSPGVVLAFVSRIETNIKTGNVHNGRAISLSPISADIQKTRSMWMQLAGEKNPSPVKPGNVGRTNPLRLQVVSHSQSQVRCAPAAGLGSLVKVSERMAPSVSVQDRMRNIEFSLKSGASSAPAKTAQDMPSAMSVKDRVAFIETGRVPTPAPTKTSTSTSTSTPEPVLTPVLPAASTQQTEPASIPVEKIDVAQTNADAAIGPDDLVTEAEPRAVEKLEKTKRSGVRKVRRTKHSAGQRRADRQPPAEEFDPLDPKYRNKSANVMTTDPAILAVVALARRAK